MSGPQRLLLTIAAALFILTACKKEAPAPPPSPAPPPKPPPAQVPAKVSEKQPAAPASAPAAAPVVESGSKARAVLEEATKPPKRAPRKVEVAGEPGNFQLKVDGKPYFIKGIGFNVDSLEYAEEEMKIVKEAGFNSLRLWGQGQANIAGLDLAEKHGLSVVPAWWLSHDLKNKPTSRDYSNEKENAAEIEAIEEWVSEIKDHPAVLMWGIGNEAYHFSGQGEAYCKHLENIFRAIKKLDPHHPVMTVDVNVSPIWDLAKHTPSLDVYGCNTYSGWAAVKSTPIEVAKVLKKPVVFTEFGPGLPGGPVTQLNYKLHAQGWVDAWKKGILAARNNCLGGYFFVFHDGRPDDIYFGLYDFQNKPKPVIAQAVRNALNATEPVDRVAVVPAAAEGFELRLNGAPYFVKGVNLRSEDLNAKAMELAAKIGLNTVRIPYETALKPEFDYLPGYGLKACVRIDLEPEHRVKQPPAGQKPAKMEWEPSGRNYGDAEQNKAAIHEIVAKVEKLKAHPALLVWEIGNETFSESTNREEFAKFLNEVCKAVHAADPNHPVAYTTAYDAGIAVFAKHTPELDILGSNSYAGPGILNSAAVSAGTKMKKPVLFMVSGFLDEGSGRSNFSEEVKTWMDVEMWRRGVLRSKPYTVGGFFRGWQDYDTKDFWGKDHKNLWGFVRKDGSPKETNIMSVREVLLERAGD